jgi:hypothetical protein
MSDVFYLSYEFVRAIVQKAVAIIGDTATDTFTADAAHGLAVGDVVAFTDLGGNSAALASRYFVESVPSSTTFKLATSPGGAAATLGTGTDAAVLAIQEIEIAWPNQAQTQGENTQYTWEGGGNRKQITLLRDLNVTFASAAIPASAHAEIFDKPTITGDLPGGMTNVRGYGGGNDKGGVSVGLRLEGYAIKSTAGVESTVDFARWYPQGTLTFTTPATQQTGQAAGTTGYTFSASRSIADIAGGAIGGAPTGGEFFYEGEV